MLNVGDGKASARFAALFILLACLPFRAAAQVVISQIYGGGGNSGALYRNDFIELFNRGTAPVDMSEWTVQYASATGTSWDRTNLGGVIEPGRYYLVQEAQGNGGTISLPTWDASGGINLSATAGKLALVKNASVLSGAAPSGSHIADFVGYGNANYAKGNPVSTLSNTTAALRRSNGCADTSNNSADFSVVSPAPRNRGSGTNLCSPLPPAPPTGPQITETGVVNAASYAGGPVAPGEIVTVFGTGIGPTALATLEVTPDKLWVTKTLAGTRVLFDGVPSAMIYTSTGQLSTVVPYSVAGRVRTEVSVEYNGRLSNAVIVPVASAAPALFTSNSSGRGQAAALNQDYTFNGPVTPSGKGSVITFYATGGGQTAPGGEDGRVVTGNPPKLEQPVRVEIGGLDAEVQYAGAAPYLVSGVLQINVVIPKALASDGAVPVRVIIGNASTQPEVTISIGPGSTSQGSSSGARPYWRRRRISGP